MMEQSILFVDDEPNVLQGLQRMLRGMRHEWNMAFATSGEAALKTLEGGPFKVVVSDMRMPGMNGVEFLNEVMKRYPQIIRIILTGHSDRELILKSVKVAHQFLAKPCDAETLKSTVARACALRDLLANETLKLIVSQMDSLPSLPALYVEITEELRSGDASVAKVGEIISKDLAMTAKILQLVNSSFFGLRRRISNPVQAVTFLGLETVKNLVLAVQIFSNFEKNKVAGLSLEELWRHSLSTGTFARLIAREEKAEQTVIDEAFMVGLLHDSGKLVLAMNFPDHYRKIVDACKTLKATSEQLEKAVFGATHAEVGAYMMGLWGLPDSIIEAIAFHHCPEKLQAPGFTSLTAVHAGNALEHEIRNGKAGASPSSLSGEYLSLLGLSDRLPKWRRVIANMIEEER